MIPQRIERIERIVVMSLGHGYLACVVMSLGHGYLACAVIMECVVIAAAALIGRQAGRNNWLYCTSTRCAIPDCVT